MEPNNSGNNSSPAPASPSPSQPSGGADPSQATHTVTPKPAHETDNVAQLKFNPLPVNEGPRVGPDAGGRGQEIPSQAGPAAPPSQSNQPPEVNGQLAQINAILQRQNQPQQQASQQQQQGQDPYAWAPNWEIPDPIVQAMMSQDPMQMKQGMAAIVNGLARATFDQARQVAQAMIGQALAQVPMMMQQTLRARDLHQKFYTTHPDLNKEALYGTVEKVAQAEAQRRQMLGLPVDVMSDEFHQAVAQATRQLVGLAAPQQQQNMGFAPPARPPYFAGNGTRMVEPSPRTEGILEQIGLA